MVRGSLLLRLLGAGLVCLLPGCSSGPTDTGFVGRWKRAGSDSVLVIGESAAGYRICREGGLDQAKERSECVGGDVTRIYRGETAIFEYRYLAEQEGERLRVAVEGEPLVPGEGAISWVDVYELGAGGVELWSRSIELRGARRLPPGAPILFRKINDHAD